MPQGKIRALSNTALRQWREALRDRAGSPAVEFALIAPVLFMMMFGLITFGIAINNYIELTDSVRSGGRALAIARLTQATSSTGTPLPSTPYTSTTSAIYGSAPNLTATSIAITVSIAAPGVTTGTPCTSDTACATALTTAGAGGTATVTAQYPCNLTVMQVNFAPGCTFTATTSDLIE
jgi:Flp pilus assembly protein TadG